MIDTCETFAATTFTSPRPPDFDSLQRIRQQAPIVRYKNSTFPDAA